MSSSVPIVRTDNSICIVYDGEPYTVDSSHPNWDRIIKALDDERWEDLYEFIGIEQERWLDLDLD